jgi:Ni/Co efflux regulator RcnB
MKRVLISVVAASLLGGSMTSAFADRPDHRPDRHSDGRYSQDWKRDRDDRNHREYRERDRDYDRHDRRHHRYRGGDYRRPHGYHHRYWRQGDRLPRAYYAPRYVVHHYHHYNLRRPPRGYHWVRVDNDIVLAAIATGIVSHVIYDLFY